jgi:hypothetical protein
MPPKQQSACATTGGARQCPKTGKWRFNYCQMVPKRKRKRAFTSAYEYGSKGTAEAAMEAHKGGRLSGFLAGLRTQDDGSEGRRFRSGW